MKKYLIIALFLLIVSSVSAIENYTTTGGFYNTFETGRGLFNTNLNPLEDVTTTIKTLNDLEQTPLINDLDNDGTNELIVLAEDTFYIYQNKELDFIASFDIGLDQDFSNFITFDIDNDNMIEIIIAKQSDKAIEVLEFNSTALYRDTNFSFSSMTYSDGECMLECRSSEDCLLVCSRYNDPVAVLGYIYGVGFNSTGVGNTALEIDTGSPVGLNLCFPKIKAIAKADYDMDGTTEYIFTGMEAGSGGNHEEIRIYYIDVNSQLLPIEEMQIDDDFPGDFINSKDCKIGLMGNYFSPPLVYDLKDTSGLETAVGYNSDEDSFIIQLYESDGDKPVGDRFPQIEKGDGVIISNVFLANAFPDSEKEDVCIMGMDTDSEEIDIVCGGKRSGETPETNIYTWDYSDDGYNISLDYGSYDIIAHSTQQSNELYNNVDLSEVLISYGVFKLDKDSCSILGNCNAERIFLNGLGSSVLMSIDLEGFGSEDLAAMSDTNLVYIDDKLSNEGAYISQATFNPCITDSIIKVNSTLQVDITIIDGNNEDVLALDRVYGNVTIYKGIARQEEIEVKNVTSGALMQFIFTLNETGTGRILEIEGWDDYNPSEIDSIERPFTVAENGIEFGDSSCTLEFVAPDEEEAISEDDPNVVDQDNNVITSSIDTLIGGYGLSRLLIWVLIMGIVSLGIWSYEGNSEHRMGIVLLANAFMIIAGFLLGFIGWGIIALITIIALIPLGLWLRKLFTGINTN